VIIMDRIENRLKKFGITEKRDNSGMVYAVSGETLHSKKVSKTPGDVVKNILKD